MASMLRGFVTALLLALAGACQTMGPAVTTASGKPETTVAVPAEKVRPVLLSALLDKGFTVKADTPYELIVEQPSKNFAANLLLGTRFNPTVDIRISFTFVPLDKSTRIVADTSVVSNPGSGFEQVTPVGNKKDVDDLQQWLDKIAAESAAKPPKA